MEEGDNPIETCTACITSQAALKSLLSKKLDRQ